MQQLGVFAKYWEPGKVKTRLAATIGNQRASSIYRSFVETLLKRLSRVGQRRVLAVAPPERMKDFSVVAGEAWSVEPQARGDLGTRMKHYFDTGFERSARCVVLMGSDSPDIPLAYVEQAFEMLEKFPVVLGPTSDGGYYLIAARDATPPVFDHIAWSTPSVWTDTIEQLDQAGLSYGQLPQWYDVDDLESLARMVENLRTMNQLDSELVKLKDRLCAEFDAE